MGRLFAWLAGLVGVAALARLLARRGRTETQSRAGHVEADPAEALRRKLSDARANVPGPQADEPGPPVAEPRESLAERRARVHAKAQAAIAEMQEPSA